MNASLNSATTVADLVCMADQMLSRLRDAVRDGQANPLDFRQILYVIEALPLDTGTFAAVACRLGNAWSYYAAGEVGAAIYEATLAQRSITRTLRG